MSSKKVETLPAKTLAYPNRGQHISSSILTPDMIRQTSLTYADAGAASTYTSVAWTNASDIYSQVFSNPEVMAHIRGLGKTGKILDAGGGSGRDVVLFLLLNKFVSVDFYDLSQAFVTFLNDVLVYRTDINTTWHFLSLLFQSPDLLSFPNGNIKALLPVIQQLQSIEQQTRSLEATMFHAFGADMTEKGAGLLHENTRELIRLVVDQIFTTPISKKDKLNRLRVAAGNHTDLHILYYKEMYDYILALSTLQHLTDSDIFSFLRVAADRLQIGGKLHFDLRVNSTNDPNYAVYEDRYLGDQNVRYILTFTPDEMNNFLTQLSSQLNSREKEYEVKYLGQSPTLDSRSERPPHQHLIVSRIR